MSRPTSKHPDIDSMFAIMFGASRTESVEANRCISCNNPAPEESFRDAISLKEFTISSLCQTCQDGVFGGGE